MSHLPLPDTGLNATGKVVKQIFWETFHVCEFDLSIPCNNDHIEGGISAACQCSYKSRWNWHDSPRHCSCDWVNVMEVIVVPNGGAGRLKQNWL